VLPTILSADPLSLQHVLQWWARRLRQLAHPTPLGEPDDRSEDESIWIYNAPGTEGRFSRFVISFGGDLNPEEYRDKVIATRGP
jgi:hypothetical protein